MILLGLMIGDARGGILWYGGDADAKGVLNNTNLAGDFGETILDDFVVENPSGWHVSEVYSNNILDLDGVASVTQASWSIRTGVGANVPGTVLFGGLAPATLTPTGRVIGSRVEYTVSVTGLSFDLRPGVYYMSVSPVADDQFYYVGSTEGLHSVGRSGPGGVFREERLIRDGVLTVDVYYTGTAAVSMGLIGTGEVPEPGSALSLGTGLLAVLSWLGRSGPSRRGSRHQPPTNPDRDDPPTLSTSIGTCGMH